MKSNLNNNIQVNDTFLTPEFWTDANGIKLMRRYKDYRTGWKYTETEKVASNFYPINYAISIREKSSKVYTENDYALNTGDDKMITMFNDRSQSGGAMEKGSLMLILNRFSKKDDQRGVDQPIYEENSLPYSYRIQNWFSVSNYYNKSQISEHIHQRPTIVSIEDRNKTDYKNFSKHY